MKSNELSIIQIITKSLEIIHKSSLIYTYRSSLSQVEVNWVILKSDITANPADLLIDYIWSFQINS